MTLRRNSLLLPPAPGWDCVVKIWDLDTGRREVELGGHTGPVRCVQFRDDQVGLAPRLLFFFGRPVWCLLCQVDLIGVGF